MTYLFSEQSASKAAQQLLCACISAVVRLHNTCCALVAQLKCSYFCSGII